ncbi:MAG: WYL domain-containing protein [Muribaculaceae bacterium]|nr:WYL domain-containing protein [Muribaculaceae bacterium]
MAQSLLNRYLWIIDTIRRHGRITRQELDRAWQKSDFSDGEKLPRRTFYNYRQAIAEIFNLEISFDASTYEYYISEDTGNQSGMTDWLLNSASMSDTLASARDIAGKIFVEDVPSAREFLSPTIEALKGNHPIVFDYLPYYRTVPTTGIEMQPLFLKIFRQRWYITGYVPVDKKIKTYALDRVRAMRVLTETFEPDAAFDPEDYFRHSFGVVFTEGPVHRVALKTPPREAKYLRALPLHPTQEEVVHDDYSIFYYRMRISPDLVGEILSHGPRVEVLEPPELRLQVRTELSEALARYGSAEDDEK